MSSLIDEFLSLPNFRQAWFKVADNQGCAGVDGETIEIFAKNEELNLIQLRDSVANNTYTPQALQQVLIPKNNGKWRALKIPIVRDRIVQQALLNVLYPMTEERFSDASFAYRPNRHYQDAVKRVAYWRDQGYQWVLDGDIVDFFDSLNHRRLLFELRKFIDNSGIICLIKSWVSAGVSTDKGIIYPEKGIPQGAVISPLLANIYLNEFDQYFSTSDCKLVRYADDFLLLSKTQDEIMLAYSQVMQLLNYMGLKLQAEKSQITHFQRGFQFLGHGFLYQAIFPMDDQSKSSKNNRKKIITAEESVSSSLSKSSLLKKKKSLSVEFGEWLQAKIREKPPEILDKKSEKFKLIWNPEMATLYLLEQGTWLHKEHQRFIVQISQVQKTEILMREVERILVFGNVQLTTSAINACFQEKILVLYLSQAGKYNGHLWSLESNHLNQGNYSDETTSRNAFSSSSI